MSQDWTLVPRGTRPSASVLSPKYEVFCCDQNGPPARRSEPDGRMREHIFSSQRFVPGPPSYLALSHWLFRSLVSLARLHEPAEEDTQGGRRRNRNAAQEAMNETNSHKIAALV